MKRKVMWIGLLAILILIVGCVAANAETSGVYRGIDWTLDDDGVLTLGNGDTQTMVDETGTKWTYNKVKSVRCSGTIVCTGSLHEFFMSSTMVSADLSGFDTSRVTGMSYLFMNCGRLTSIDLSGWDISKVTELRGMFFFFFSLTSVNLSGWNTSKVRDMSSMFSQCSSLTGLSLPGFVTAGTNNIGFMFSGCALLTDLDFSGWDTSNVTNLTGLFNKCSALTSVDLSAWNVGNVTSMTSVFNECSALNTVNLSGWDVSKVTGFDNMFHACSSLENVNLAGWNPTSTTSLYQMFYGCASLTGLDLSNWDVRNVTSMSKMFYNCSTLVNLNLSGFQTRDVTNLSYMFYGCASLLEVSISQFDTSHVTNMAYMFANCASFDANVANLDTSSVTDMSNMFYKCSSLTELDLSGWTTNVATKMYQMFADCNSLVSLNVSNFTTNDVTSMYQMFDNCSALVELDLSKWNTGSVTNMSQMFTGCTALESLNISGFDTSNVTSLYQMFRNCSSLVSLDLSGFDVSKATSIYQMFDNCKALEFVILGNYNPFKGKGTSTNASTALPTPPGSKDGIAYTRKWIREDKTYGPYTPAELRNNYTSAMAGKWVWEKVPTEYSINFVCNEDGYLGEMPPVTVVAAADYELPGNAFRVFGFEFEYWTDGTRRTWEDKAIIPANTYAVGAEVTLTAVFAPRNRSVDMQDGSFDFSIKGNEKALFQPIPASTSYQVYEQTPFGWNLIKQSNNVGVIEPDMESEVLFLNKYDPLKATVRFAGTKLMDESVADPDSYNFLLYEDNTLVDIATVGDAGVIEFQPITYDQAGIHNYTIQEVIGNDNSVEYDTHVESIVVTVESDGAGHLSVDIQRKAGMDSTDESREGMFYYEVQFVTQNGQPYELASSDISYEEREGDISEFPEAQPLPEKPKRVLLVQHVVRAIDGSETVKDTDRQQYRSGDVAVISVLDPSDWPGTVKYYFDSLDVSDFIRTESGWKGIMPNEDLSVKAKYYPYQAISGSVVFADDNNADGKRPESVVVHIVDEGGSVAYQTVSASTDWRFAFEDIPVFNNDTQIDYEVQVESVEGYKALINGTAITMSSNTAMISYSLWNRYVNTNSTTLPLRSATSLSRDDTYNSVDELPIDAVKIDTDKTGCSIYFWMDGTDAKWWSDADVVYLSSDCSYMFNKCSQLVSVDIEQFDTSKVTTMRNMFSECNALASLDTSGFDTSKVRDMSDMFYRCEKLTYVNLSNWDTTKVTTMGNMFRYCAKLQDVDVSHFVTSNVTTMRNMFDGCNVVRVLDVSNFDTTNIKYMDYMFSGCRAVTILDVSGFNTENVQTMQYMFNGCSHVKALDVTHFDTRKVTKMTGLFSYCADLQSLDVTSFNTSLVTELHSMFAGCTKLESLDLSNFDLSLVSSLYEMFYKCESLVSVNLTGWDTSGITTMCDLFSGCHALPYVDVTMFNTSNVTNMANMFNTCWALNNIDVSGFDTHKVTTMRGMFDNCQSLTAIDLLNFDTSSVTSMDSMFFDDKSLTTLDLSAFDTSSVTDMDTIFQLCEKLRTIYVSDLWTTENVTSAIYPFSQCYVLVGGAGTPQSGSAVGIEYARIDNPPDEPGYLTYKARPEP